MKAHRWASQRSIMTKIIFLRCPFGWPNYMTKEEASLILRVPTSTILYYFIAGLLILFFFFKYTWHWRCNVGNVNLSWKTVKTEKNLTVVRSSGNVNQMYSVSNQAVYICVCVLRYIYICLCMFITDMYINTFIYI